MKLSEFYYDLPRGLVAQEPLEERSSSRLMVLDRSDKSITERAFSNIKDYIAPGDCLVLNDTRVLMARLYGKRKTGGKVEVFLLDTSSQSPQALVRPSKRIKEGEVIELESGKEVSILGKANVGRYVQFNSPIEEVLKNGHVPLPPYITREDAPSDKEKYQTVYASKRGATASPTAGLHFTKALLDGIRAKGVSIAFVTLHTSYGTFAPVQEEEIESHIMHSERYEITEEAAQAINRTKSSGGRVFAVGTTSTRVLETASRGEKKVTPSSGETNLFIYPGYKFKIIDSIITNFHLPESTLLMLVSAFAGRDFVLKAYKKAIAENYRFFSYGDAMLIL